MIEQPVPRLPAAVPNDWLEYPVLFDPASAQQALRAARTNKRLRLVSLVISIGIVVAVYFIWRDNFSSVYWWVAGIGLLLPVGLAIWAFVMEVGARRDASQVVDGLAFGIGRDGLFIGGEYVPWTGVADLEIKPARRGRAMAIVCKEGTGNTWRLPVEHMTVGVGTLDSAVRALSGGRVWVDFSALDV